MSDTVSDSSVEGEIINDVWESFGDIDENDRHISSTSMWRFLRLAVERTDTDMDSWAPEAITSQADFTIDPVPTQAQIDVIKACMIWLVCRKDYYSHKQDGIGIVMRGGMDTIDSKTLLLQAHEAMKDSKKEYQRALISYNSNVEDATYADNELYDTGRTGTITVN